MSWADDVLRLCDEVPDGALVVFVNLGRGELFAECVRRVHPRGVRVLGVDRWKRCIEWMRENAPDTFGGWSLYQGRLEDAARGVKPGRVHSVIYLSGAPSLDELEGWLPTMMAGGVVRCEGGWGVAP